jgi:hypothetical protein
MSRILRRPMFRGGKVIDSRGTGITSGLMDGGRVGYYRGGGPTFNPFAASQVPAGQLGGQISRRTAPTPDYSFLDTINISEFFKPVNMASGEPFKPRVNPGKVLKSREELEEENEELKSQQVDTGDLGDERLNVANLERGEQNLAKANETEEPEISAEDAIRENAELFKELLGEASKEDIKKARIQDASDYALKFFEETIGKGKGAKEAAGAVAGFATGRESRVDKAREAVKKTDQTGVALAINDYIAGKRSKEEINKLLAGYAAKAQLAKGDVASEIAKFATSQGYLPGVDVIKTYIRDDDSLAGKEIVEFDSKKQGGQKVEYSPGDENKVFIDISTKKVFTFTKDGLPLPISG